jgi:hypothetical protein
MSNSFIYSGITTAVRLTNTDATISNCKIQSGATVNTNPAVYSATSNIKLEDCSIRTTGGNAILNTGGTSTTTLKNTNVFSSASTHVIQGSTYALFEIYNSVIESNYSTGPIYLVYVIANYSYVSNSTFITANTSSNALRGSTASKTISYSNNTFIGFTTPTVNITNGAISALDSYSNVKL